MIVDEWKGMYPSAWKGIITPESFSHPAKFSSRLIERIYQHGIECGWLAEGSRIVDPFGGVGLGAWPALRFGMSWSGVELESRFVTLAQANIDAWNARYSGRLARWGTARIIQGDSRHLAQVLASADGCISSPPYSGEALGHDGGGGPNATSKHRADYEEAMRRVDAKSNYGTTPGNLGNLPPGHLAQVISAAEACISSPPYAENDFHSGGWHAELQNSPTDPRFQIYGSSPGQLASLPPGAPPFDGCVSSPPYAESMEKAGGIDPSKSIHVGGPHSQMNNSDTRYGHSPGQLASLPPGAPPFDAAISSPPYEETVLSGGGGIANEMRHTYREGQNYGDTTAQVGGMAGDTFWSAAREIVAQVYQVLAPGAHAIWVVKSYVKNKQLVEFPHQWQALCEACGFVTLHEHHALLVRYGATSIDIDGNHHEHKTESKSFFRRLAEKNGSPRIDYETVLCMVKPGGEGGGWDGAISSPPFTEDQPCASQTQALKDYHAFTRGDGTKRDHTMTTPGNLGSLPPGSLDDATRHGG